MSATEHPAPTPIRVDPAATPIRVVLDTNVVVALMVFGDPALCRLSELWRDDKIVAIADEETLAEFDRVLRYPELKVDEARAVAMGRAYRERCIIVGAGASMARKLPQCRDPDDQKFLLLAQRGGASCVVTRDKALLALRKRLPFGMLTPERFGLP